MSQVVFFSDEGEKSQEARRLLIKNGLSFEEMRNGVDYEICPEDPINPPCIIGIYGQFMGIKAVRRYIALWKADPRR